MNAQKIKEYADKLVATDEFWLANYYSRSMKKTNHGGAEKVEYPNYYLRLKYVESSRWLHCKTEAPFFLVKVVEKASELYYETNIDINDLLFFLLNDNNFWVIVMEILKPKTNVLCKEIAIIEDMKKGCDLTQFYDYSLNSVLCAFVCKLIHDNRIKLDINAIERKENLVKGSDKYGLFDVTDAEFLSQGFILNDYYYLYNIFFDVSIGAENDRVPKVVRLLKEKASDARIYMRCDKNLAVPKNSKFETSTMDFVRYRGKSFGLLNIDRIIKGKEIVVYFDPRSRHKILISVHLDNNEEYQIAIECLWQDEAPCDEIITTTFLHGTYSAKTKLFYHVDFSVNQYDIVTYKDKFKDDFNKTSVPIDKYADSHYKVWCLKGKIDIATWEELVYSTIDEPFISLFDEFLGKETTKEYS